jgi:hypothetical protein
MGSKPSGTGASWRNVAPPSPNFVHKLSRKVDDDDDDVTHLRVLRGGAPATRATPDGWCRGSGFSRCPADQTPHTHIFSGATVPEHGKSTRRPVAAARCASSPWLRGRLNLEKGKPNKSEGDSGLSVLLPREAIMGRIDESRGEAVQRRARASSTEDMASTMGQALANPRRARYSAMHTARSSGCIVALVGRGPILTILFHTPCECRQSAWVLGTDAVQTLCPIHRRIA